MEDTETPLVSASQIKLFGDECQRKWGFSYLAKLKTPPNAAAALGIDVDDNQLQPYLRTGRAFDYSKESGHIAAAGLAYLPKPMSLGLEVQKHFKMPSHTTQDFAYQGYMDLWLPKGGMPDLDGEYPVVCDFKTTSNFRYAKTTETLATDVQAQLYAMNAFWETRAPAVDLVWLYFSTKGPRKVKRVHLRMFPDKVAAQFEKINTTAVEMFGIRKAFEALSQPERAEDFVLHELPPNPDMCEVYGGCPYRSRCNLSPDQIVDAHAAKHEAFRAQGNTLDMSNEDTVSLLASLRKRQAPPPVSVVGINPPESTLAPAPAVGVAAAPAALVEPAKLLQIEEPKKRGRPAGSKNATKDPLGADAHAYASPAVPVDAYEAAIAKASAGLSEYELRADAVKELAATIGSALSKFAAQLEVTK